MDEAPCEIRLASVSAVVGMRRPFTEAKHRRGVGGKFAPKGGVGSVAGSGQKKGTSGIAAQIKALSTGGTFRLPNGIGRITKTENGFRVTVSGKTVTATTVAEAMSVAARLIRTLRSKAVAKQSTARLRRSAR